MWFWSWITRYWSEINIYDHSDVYSVVIITITVIINAPCTMYTMRSTMPWEILELANNGICLPWNIVHSMKTNKTSKIHNINKNCCLFSSSRTVLVFIINKCAKIHVQYFRSLVMSCAVCDTVLIAVSSCI